MAIFRDRDRDRDHVHVDRRDDTYDRFDRDDRDDGKWGLLSLLLIPLLLLGGLWAYNTYRDRNTTAARTNEVVERRDTPSDLQVGVGGGNNGLVNEVSPTSEDSATLSNDTSPTSPTVTSGVQQGVGGSGTSMPNSAPATGLGGASY